MSLSLFLSGFLSLALPLLVFHFIVSLLSLSPLMCVVWVVWCVCLCACVWVYVSVHISFICISLILVFSVYYGSSLLESAISLSWHDHALLVAASAGGSRVCAQACCFGGGADQIFWPPQFFERAPWTPTQKIRVKIEVKVHLGFFSR